MTRLACCTVAWFALASAAHAQIFYPILHSASPCAVQVGATTACTVNASNNGASGVYRVLIGGKGVTGEVVPPGDPKALAAPPDKTVDARVPTVQLKIRFTAAADAPLGMRDVRVLSPNGASTLGQIVVVRDALVTETEPNDTLARAQAIAWPATVCGKIASNEDVDYYKFKVKAGDALTFHVWGQRLQNRLTSLTYFSDPLISIRNSAGTVLASSDNFFGADPCLHYRFATAGEYLLEVRDMRYLGYRSWDYAVEIHDRPFATAISPACLPPGVPTKVRLIGHNLPAEPTVTVTLPTDALPWDQWLTLPVIAGRPLNAVQVRPSNLPTVREAATPHDSIAQAQHLDIPCAVGGALKQPGEVDFFAFDARKGERFSFSTAARPLDSELDSVLRILNGKGEVLVENDDASDKYGRSEFRNEILNADSRIDAWEAPADGRYFVQVSDVHDRGGERFVYTLFVRRAQPHFLLETSTDKTILSPGTAGVIFVRTVRKDGFTGDIQLSVEGLPGGVTAVCGSIPGPCQDGCILLRAGGAQPRTFGNIRVLGTAVTRPGQPAETVLAQPYQELMRDGGARYLVPVNEHAVFVADSLDLKAVQIRPQGLTIRPGETKKIEVTIERRPGFNPPVTLTLISTQHVWTYGNCLPPGVQLDAASVTRLAGDQLTATLILKAAPDAKPVRRQLVPVMAAVAVNFSLSMYFPGDPLWLTVETPR